MEPVGLAGLGVMGLLGMLCCAGPMILIVWGIQGALFRLAARWVGGVDVSWPFAVITVVAASFVQGLFTGLFFGADVGLCGAIAGYLVWAGVAAFLTDLDWGQALIVAFLMVFLSFVLWGTLAALAFVFGVGAVLAGAGMAGAGI